MIQADHDRKVQEIEGRLRMWKTGGGLKSFERSAPTDIRFLLGALKDKQAEVGKTCGWIDEEDGYWKTGCDLAWCLTNEEGLAKNNMNYCPKCGGTIVEGLDD